ncbi:hypothetical protein GCM10018790_55190 [Kitasatospora xanthocidica]|uniref:hypothetical protein n=1 Tax=Kitasatospora xanthocidica TaxID=83382 RepID=UPI0016745DB3|nr:hypothetical protein [Kitasatospora xanthocidica]GHF70229.1 hypothetical protein GCM10018790_55190 [Kitasatospora xanthocidica]
MPPPFAPLRNPVRRYAWGSATAIPALTGAEPDGTPQAELWLGAELFRATTGRPRATR